MGDKSAIESVVWPAWLIRRSAAAIGISEVDYRSRLEAGEKWCIGCRAWHARNAFGRDRAQGDGLRQGCRVTYKRPDHRRPPSNRGRKASLETRERMAKAHRGDRSPTWRGGITVAHRGIRWSAEYKAWRRAVFVRDGYTCRSCGKRGGWLEAHHIRPFATDVAGQLDPENGLTLCKRCHRAAHCQEATRGG